MSLPNITPPFFVVHHILDFHSAMLPVIEVQSDSIDLPQDSRTFCQLQNLQGVLVSSVKSFFFQLQLSSWWILSGAQGWKSLILVTWLQPVIYFYSWSSTSPQLAPLNAVVSVSKVFFSSVHNCKFYNYFYFFTTTTATDTSTTHYCPLMISPDRIRCRHSVSPTPTINTPCLVLNKNRKAHLYIFTTV